MITFPNAKINLGLYVVQKRTDGYHDLETAFFPIPLHDVLEIKPLKHSNQPYEFQFAGSKVDGNPEENLIYKTYALLRDEFHLPPLSFYLYKKIPTGAGLGGGSSDAAYTMKMLNELFSLHLTADEMEQRMAPLGADCPFFIRNEPVFATGIGNKFSPLPIHLKGLYFVLIKPEEAVSTRQAYQDVHPQPAPFHWQETLLQPVNLWRGNLRNDFEKSVFLHHPHIAAIKQTLYDMGALYASMSGSGSSVFGFFQTPFDKVESIFTDCFCFQQQLTDFKQTICE